MKRIISCLLIFALCAAFAPHALAKAEEEPAVVSFEQLQELVIAGNTAHQSYLQEIRKLELTYDELESERRPLRQRLLQMPAETPTEISDQLWDALTDMESIMEKIQETIDELKDAQGDVVTQITFPAEMMYIAHYILMLDVDILLREQEMLQRELANTRLKLSRGLASQGDLKNAEKNVDALNDMEKALRDAIEDNLDALARHLGLDGPIELDGLPEIDFDRITQRDSKADLAAYIEAVCATEEKAFQDARAEVRSNNTSVNRFARDNARRDYDNARKNAEADFPKVIDALLEAYDDYVESTLVSDAQEDYDKAALQHGQGLLSANMLLGLDIRLETAKARYEQQRIQLWILLMEYEFGLIKF